jgi:hypothetical protein
MENVMVLYEAMNNEETLLPDLALVPVYSGQDEEHSRPFLLFGDNDEGEDEGMDEEDNFDDMDDDFEDDDFDDDDFDDEDDDYEDEDDDFDYEEDVDYDDFDE